MPQFLPTPRVLTCAAWEASEARFPARASGLGGLSQRGWEGAGPAARGAGPRVASAAAAAGPRPRHLGLLLFSRGGTASVWSPRETRSWSSSERGDRVPALSCFPKAAAGAGTNILRLVSDALQWGGGVGILVSARQAPPATCLRRPPRPAHPSLAAMAENAEGDLNSNLLHAPYHTGDPQLDTAIGQWLRWDKVGIWSARHPPPITPGTLS